MSAAISDRMLAIVDCSILSGEHIILKDRISCGLICGIAVTVFTESQCSVKKGLQTHSFKNPMSIFSDLRRATRWSKSAGKSDFLSCAKLLPKMGSERVAW